MKAAGISGITPEKRWRTTIRIPGITPATDLVERQFRPDAPNVLWVADITYLRTGEGWLYLAAVQDTYSRQIVGWSMATNMRATLVVDALRMALHRRRPGPGLIHHSDQGSQYVSLAFGRAAGEAGIAVSMASRGDAYDNAVAETFFATLKKELVHRRSWPSRLALQSAVFEYIEAFYNRQRRHSTLNMLSPTNYEQQTTLAAWWLRSITRTTQSEQQTPCRANRGKSGGRPFHANGDGSLSALGIVKAASADDRDDGWLSSSGRWVFGLHFVSASTSARHSAWLPAWASLLSLDRRSLTASACGSTIGLRGAEGVCGQDATLLHTRAGTARSPRSHAPTSRL
jgi:transposase-like protein